MSNYIYLDELEEAFKANRKEIKEANDYTIDDAVNWTLINELCERGFIESYSWDFKNGLVFEMRKGWRDASAY